MMILLVAKGGANPTPPRMETFQYLNTLAFASNHSAGKVYLLSSYVQPPPMN